MVAGGQWVAVWCGEGFGVVMAALAKWAACGEVNGLGHGVPRLVGFYRRGHSRRLTGTGGNQSRLPAPDGMKATLDHFSSSSGLQHGHLSSSGLDFLQCIIV